MGAVVRGSRQPHHAITAVFNVRSRMPATSATWYPPGAPVDPSAHEGEGRAPVPEDPAPNHHPYHSPTTRQSVLVRDEAAEEGATPAPSSAAAA